MIDEIGDMHMLHNESGSVYYFFLFLSFILYCTFLHMESISSLQENEEKWVCLLRMKL